MNRTGSGARQEEAHGGKDERDRWDPPLEVVEMPLVQTAFDFSAAEPEAPRVPAGAVAAVLVRFQAGVLDAALILLASGLFFSLFAWLGGELSFGRRHLLIYLLASFVLASLYFGLFTLFGSRTPGMQTYGLHAVTFDRRPLPPQRAAWRAFGYLVSLASLLLGFFWALLDDRGLTWHDHVSQTFITDRPLGVDACREGW